MPAAAGAAAAGAVGGTAVGTAAATGGIAAAYTAGGLAAAAAYAAAYTFTALALSVGLSTVSTALMVKPKTSALNAGRKFTQRGSVVARPIAYGEVLTAGTLVFGRTSGDDNKWLDLALALVGPEITEITDVYFNDEKIPASAINGGDPAGGAVSGGGYTVQKVFEILNALPSLKVFANIQELDSYLDAMQAKSRLNRAGEL